MDVPWGYYFYIVRFSPVISYVVGEYFSPHNGTISQHGEVVERLMAPVLKTGECNSSVGSNPTLTANMEMYPSGEGAPLLRE